MQCSAAQCSAVQCSAGQCMAVRVTVRVTITAQVIKYCNMEGAGQQLKVNNNKIYISYICGMKIICCYLDA